jgi:Galactose oxidase, central domain
MPFFSRKKLPSNSPPANGLATQSTQQPRPVCTWSAHVPQTGSSPSPFPRSGHTLTATATAAGELFLFGGRELSPISASSDLYVFSTRDFSTTLLQTSGEVPAPRGGHGAALIGTSTLLISGGKDNKVLNHESVYLLNLGTSDL